MNPRTTVMTLLRTLTVLVLAGVAYPTARALACDFAFECGALNPCEITSCVNRVCVSTPKNCSDGDDCTVDKCNRLGVGCYHEPLCPDHDNLICNGGYVCYPQGQGFAECIETVLICDDGNYCTLDGCVEPTGCRHVAVNCDDGNPCTSDGCAAIAGCSHAPVAGCCRTGGDCPADKCTDRQCVGARCSAGTPRSCDDGDAATVDACDPGTGCVHTPDSSTSTTTSLPGGGGCRTDGECQAPADACEVAACSPSGACGSSPVTGFDRLACVCRRADAAACAGATLPERVVRKRARACVFIGQASTNTTKARKLIGRAARLLKRAQKGVAHAKHLSADCAHAESGLLADGQTRALEVRDQL